MKRPSSFTREQINNDPELYEAVGAAFDSQDLDDAYAAHRMAGMNHFLAKEQAFYDVMGREYPYGRPGAASERDEAVVEQLRTAVKNKQLESDLKDAQKDNQLRMAGQVMAGAGGAAGLIALIDLLQSPKIEEKDANYR